MPRALLNEVLRVRAGFVGMLRRYLIVNGVSTVVMYGAIWAALPSLTGSLSELQATVESVVTGNSVLGPILNGIVAVSAGLGF